jgi:hypothetical protein
MFWNKNKTTISVRFIDNSTNNEIARSNVPVAQLPDTFELETTLDMPGGKYQVTNATPKNKPEFQKTGKLEIYLHKIEFIDPSKLLYSLPTIENSIFDSCQTENYENTYKIHEDDWRQLEFISRNLLDDVNSEFTKIHDIYQNYRAGVGFSKVHIRQAVPNPLTKTKLDLENILSDFNPKHIYDGFSSSNRTLARNSFAFEIEFGVVIFGTKSDSGYVNTLCISKFNLENHEYDAFCIKNDLILVDWIKTTICIPSV